MIPYWITTCLFLSLDFVILDKSYSISNILLTFSGINLSVDLRHIDYCRWFVTFILLWYTLFFITNSLFSAKKSAIVLTGISFILLPLHYYFFDFSWYLFFSFPAGCLLAAYYEQIVFFFKQYKKTLLLISLFLSGYIVTYMTMVNSGQLHEKIFRFLPDILFKYHDELVYSSAGIFVFFLSGYFTKKGLTSKLLEVTGKYSYELFLLHGPFLIKYNPIIKDTGTFSLTAETVIFIFTLLFLSFLLAKLSGFFIKKLFRESYCQG